ELGGVGAVVLRHLGIADFDVGRRLRQDLLHGLLLVRRCRLRSEEAALPCLQHERALLEEGVEEAALHFGVEGGASAALHLGEVTRELAAPHRIFPELQDHGIRGLGVAAAEAREQKQGGRAPHAIGDYRPASRRSSTPPSASIWLAPSPSGTFRAWGVST